MFNSSVPHLLVDIELEREHLSGVPILFRAASESLQHATFHTPAFISVNRIKT